MPPVGFEPTISAEERPQTHALDRAATGIDATVLNTYIFSRNLTGDMLYIIFTVLQIIYTGYFNNFEKQLHIFF